MAEAAPPTTTTAPPTTAPANWRDALPDDLKSSPVLAKYDSPEKVYRAALSLEQRLGAQDQYIQKPKDWNDEKARNSVFEALGRPADPAKYELDLPKDLKPDDEMVGKLKASFHAAGLNGFQAKAMLNSILAMTADGDKAHQTAMEQHKATSEAALKAEYGVKYQENVELATRAITHIFNEKAANALKEMNLMSDADFVRGMVKLGTMMKEGGIDIGRGEAGNGGVEGALAQIKQLQASPEFQEQFLHDRHPKHAEAMAKWNALHKQAYGTEPAQARRA